MARIRRILHPSDFSKASGAAFTKALELAKANGADLVLLHVLAPPLPLMAGDGYVSPQVYEDLDKSARAYASKELAGLVAKAKKAGVRANAVLRDGVAHEQIIRAARSPKADMIVIGTHGRTGLAKLFLGSVAGRVVSTATCPVMTIRGK
jgi:nucleotide-binding universal stress UspA family protein